MTTFSNVFSAGDIEYLFQREETVAARLQLDNIAAVQGKASFRIPISAIPESVIAGLASMGVHMAELPEDGQLPMRWIKGDTVAHVDVGSGAFEKTHLVYLSDTSGQFLVGDAAFSIQANEGIVFDTGVVHGTENMGSAPRLLVGPMNERAEPVGVWAMNYFFSEADALATNWGSATYGYSADYTVGVGGPYGDHTYWRIASNSYGPASQSIVYANGDVLDSSGPDYYYYFLYPATICFLEGTKILCQREGQETYVPIEDLKSDDLVKTGKDGFKKVAILSKGVIHNPASTERIQDRLYKCSLTQYPTLFEDLYITGCHSILVDSMTDAQKESTVAQLGRLFITDDKYRLMAVVDEKAEPWASEGTYPIWHLALENENDGWNYGIYANGLLVESCSIRSLRSRSNLSAVF